MAILKCKMCGGTLEINNNETVAICEYCGTKQTLPKLDDDKRVQLHDRANYFRRENEFDKAMGIYEMILGDDSEDSESYWGIVLCRYGVEYVEDPRSHKRVPTINRAQLTSVFDDADYKNAIKYADSHQREIYEAEATVIDKIQKGILEISNKEEPFDVFICYKETDKKGNRTKDSVYAQDIYTALTKEGYKVFFARITLEAKLGSVYEPYIFAALNSAKVMLVVGTEKDNFNAVWVKNEWSRFLSLIKAGKDKTLIPVYRDINPYDMPEEFQYLQSQDLAKIGAIQDLIHGVRKLMGENKTAVKETVEVKEKVDKHSSLLERAYLFLEDGDFQSANNYFEKVLDLDPKNGQAYLGKLMVDLKVCKPDDIGKFYTLIDKNANYQKAYRFGDINLRAKLDGYTDSIKQNIKEEIYKKAVKNLEESRDYMVLVKTSESFKSLSGYKDSENLAKQCLEKAKEIEEEKKKNEAEEKELKKDALVITSVVLSVIALVIVFTVLLKTVIIPRYKFSDIVAVSAGTMHTVAVKPDGTVVATGYNAQGQCDVDDWTDIIAVSADNRHTVGLKSDGTVVAAGDNSDGQCRVSSWTDIIAVSAGAMHTVAVKSDGIVVATGSNLYGQCDVDDWTDIIAASVGASHTVGLKSDGTVIATGSDYNGQCNIDDWTDIIAISAGAFHTVGLRSDGKVVTVGDNSDGQCNVGHKK